MATDVMHYTATLPIRYPPLAIGSSVTIGCHVDCDDAAGQVPIFHLAKSGLAQHGRQPFLIGKRADRGGQVFIDSGPVSRHLRADPGSSRKEYQS